MEYIRGLKLQVTLVHATNMSVEPVTVVQPDADGDADEGYVNMPNDSSNADDDAATEVGTQADVNIDDHGGEGNESGAGVGGSVDATVDGGGSGVFQEDCIHHEIGQTCPETDISDGYVETVSGKDEVGPNEHHIEIETVSGKDEVGPNEHHVEGVTVDKDEVGPNEHHVQDELSQRLDRDQIESELKSIKSTVGGIEERVGYVDVSNLLVQLDFVKKRIGVLEDVLGVRFEQNSVVCDDKSQDVHADTPTLEVCDEKSEDVHADTTGLEVRDEKTQDVVCDNKV